jgi:hypothetical protein
MASPPENPKAVRGEAFQHTCEASPFHYNLDRPKCSVPTGHHAGDRWPHTAHDLRSCFRTNVLPYRQPAGRNRLQRLAAVKGINRSVYLSLGPARRGIG